MQKAPPGRGGLATNTAEQPDAPEIEQARDEEAAHEKQYRDLVAATASPPVRMKFDPPMEYDGHTYTEIVCDFEKLIGADFIRCEREFRRQYKADKGEVPFPEMNPLYHVILIAHAANVPLGLVRKLPGRYYTPLRTEALKVCGSSAEEEEA